MHGKPANVRLLGDRGSLFGGMPKEIPVARYHSLYARRSTLPACLAITAETEDGIVMAVEHTSRPFAAVQFHPESILTTHAHGSAPPAVGAQWPRPAHPEAHSLAILGNFMASCVSPGSGDALSESTALVLQQLH